MARGRSADHVGDEMDPGRLVVNKTLSLSLCIKRKAGISSLLGVAGNAQPGGSALRPAPTMHLPPVARVGMWHIRKKKIKIHLFASMCAAETLSVQRKHTSSLTCGCSGCNSARSSYPPGDKPAGFSHTSPELLLAPAWVWFVP